MKLTIALLVFASLVFSVQSKCKMRSECAMVGGHPKPCPVDQDGLPLTKDLSPAEAEEIVDIFVNRCPNLALDDNGEIKPYDEILTCCDHIQLQKMDEGLTIAEGVLGRCPTCLRNFQRQICEMNCNTDQSRYIDVEVATTTDGTNIEYVNVINYRMYEVFMEDAFLSCSGVMIPQSGIPAVNMMCGSAAVCDAEAWLGFTGDTLENPLAPVQVNFLKWPTPEDSMSVRAPLCNETLPGDLPCSCVDCLAKCPVGSEPYEPPLCTVLGLNCIAFSTAIVFFVITVTIFSILTVIDYKKTRYIKFKPPVSEPQKINRLVIYLQKLFSKVSVFSASHPAVIIMLTSWISFGMLFGVLNIQLTANPIELWSSTEARGRQELNYFNSRFGPFYRAAQVFLTIDLEPFEVNNITYGPAFRFEALQQLIKVEDAILDIGRAEGGVVLEDVCYAPNRLPGTAPDLSSCVSMSLGTYLGPQNTINNDTYLNTIQNCLNNPYNFDCLASWGGGADPLLVLGGYDDDILTANTIVISFPIANQILEEALKPTLEWEDKFINLMMDYEANEKPDFVTIAFAAERSIEDEIKRISVAEAVPMAISYVIMFIYVVVALGNIRSWKTYFVDSKIMVAVASIVIVLNSIYCALGVMGYFGVSVALFAINVIPFFVLSVGIDNVFLMVNTLQEVQSNPKNFDDYRENMSYSEKRNFIFEKMLIKVGPSMFVSSVTQITCFALASITNFPAVVTFAVFASVALGFLFLLQITTVVAILSIDYKRATQNRFDVLCCIQKKILNDEDPLNSETPFKSVTQKLMEPYSKFIVDWRVKICVAILFMAMATVSVVMIPHIEIGLDQEMALPPDSYVYKYLLAVANYLKMGPPVYFVLKGGLNFSDINHQNAICGGQLCNDDSLTTQIFLASLHSDVTYVSRSSNSWLDDFIDWSSLYGACCKYNTTDNGFCQSTDNAPECSYCTIEKNEWSNGLRPHPEAFERYIPSFLQDAPSEICNKGGLASYANNVNYVLDSEERATIQDTNFMAYHTNLRNSHDYITAIYYGYQISENITRAIKKNTGLDIEVFPYSVFYPFYEQYLTIWKDSFLTIVYCITGAIIFNLIASGFSLMTTFTVMFTSTLVFVDMMGIMYVWNIPLNAVSNMNLIVSIGIGVEFCSHIAYSYITSKRPPRERVEDAVQSVGATIITGITFTNIPIIVLAFSLTQVIEVFFFRMFFSIVILSFLHGMVFYPVLISYVDNLRSK